MNMNKLLPVLFCFLLLGCVNQVAPTPNGPIIFEVSKNGEVLTRAGAEDLGVLGVTVDALGPLGKDSVNRCNNQCDSPLLLMSTGGLTSRKDPQTDEHLMWILQNRLKVGDVIQVRIRDDVQADPVTKRIPKKN